MYIGFGVVILFGIPVVSVLFYYLLLKKYIESNIGLFGGYVTVLSIKGESRTFSYGRIKKLRNGLFTLKIVLNEGIVYRVRASRKSRKHRRLILDIVDDIRKKSTE